MKKSIFLKSLIALTVLSSILLSAFLGVTRAEYFKSLSKKLGLEIKPDLTMEYYLVDADQDGDHADNDHQGSAYKGKKGVYRNAESFVQNLAIGRKNANSLSVSGYDGKEIVYQVKIPVDEEGYYTLDFTVDFLAGPSGDPSLTENQEYIEADTYHTISYQYCVGCEILTLRDSIKFGDNTPFRMANRTSKDNTDVNNSSEPIFYSDSGTQSVYQWKTITPSRAETVKLAFKVESADVEAGYVTWAWDLQGMEGSRRYRLKIDGLSINKTMNLDGTTQYRDSDDPYFMFPQTAFTNNQIYYWSTQNNIGQKGSDGKNIDTAHSDYRRGSNVPGKTGYSDGRGTFVTEATANSLGMGAEMLYSGYQDSSKQWFQDNPIALYIPVKNIKKGVTYKVTFDFSVARQGNRDAENNKNNANNVGESNWFDYADFDEIFRTNSSTTNFLSYLYNGSPSSIGTTNAAHGTARNTLRYANKERPASSGGTYSGGPLTKYNEVTSKTIDNTTVNTSGTVNDTYTTSGTETVTRNQFNAIQHVERNGQQGINWITFYNTTFAFNIDPSHSNNNSVTVDPTTGKITDLYWVWQIDSFVYMGYYNIRIDNVRIEEVVEFASELKSNGVKIANTQIGLSQMKYWGKDTHIPDTGPFNNFRGWNGTGENYQSRGYDQTNYYSSGNIYAPIIDATKIPAAPGGGTGDNDYKIVLNGSAVCKGGILKYVYSADGGLTWYDMTFTGKSNSDEALTEPLNYLENGVDQRTSDQSNADEEAELSVGYEHIDFNTTDNDHLNNDFRDWALVADLSRYRGQSNLDIIIAAVPMEKRDSHCEILRIINYHAANNYVSLVEAITSDIKLNSDGNGDGLTKLKADLNLMSYTSGNSGTFTADHYPTSERGVYSNLTNSSYRNYDFESLLPLTSDISVYTKLTVSGSIVCWDGVYEYCYSVDGGKTWSQCDSTMANFVPGKASTSTGKHNGDYDPTVYENSVVATQSNGTKVKYVMTVYEKLLYKFVSRSTANDSHYFEDTNGKFNTGDSRLKLDLSKYQGQVVDVIVAAKPNFQGDKSKQTDIYLPIAKIDNVAVYGDPTLDEGTSGRGMGTFYTKLYDVTFESKEGGVITTATMKTHDGKDYFCRYGWPSSLGFHESSYTYLESYHVDPLATRLYDDQVHNVMSGGRVTIDGFSIVPGGVKKYKFSLDGGESWADIPMSTVKSYSDIPSTQKETDETTNQQIVSQTAFNNVAKKADNTFNVAGAEGTKMSYREIDSAKLEFNLPALTAGVEKNLLVVAESNIDNGEKNPDGTSKNEGFIYPVLHIKIKAVYKTGMATQYGYMRSADATTATMGWVTNSQVWSFRPNGSNGSNNARNKMTIPVSEVGLHTLEFNAELYAIESAPNTSGVRAMYNNYNETYIVAGTNAQGTNTKPGANDKPYSVYAPGFKFGEIKKSDGTAGSLYIQTPKTHYTNTEEVHVTYHWDLWNQNPQNQTNGDRRPAIQSAYILIYPVETVTDATTGKTVAGGKPVAAYPFNAVVYTVGREELRSVPANSGIIAGETISGANNSSYYTNNASKTGVTTTSNGENRWSVRDGEISFALTDLPAGEYRIMFLNFAPILYSDDPNTDSMMKSWLLNHVNDGADPYGIPWQSLTEEITIYIGDEESFPEVTANVYSDSGETLMYNTLAAPLGEDGASKCIGEYTFPSSFGTHSGQSIAVNVTAEDVKRGYIVWEWDFTGLDAGTSYEFRLTEIKLVKDGATSVATQSWDLTPNPSINNAIKSITVPVTETGEHKFALVQNISNGPSTVTNDNVKLYNSSGTPNLQHNTTTQRTADITLTANKTHYFVDEPINIGFNCEYNSGFSGGFGKVSVAIVSEDWLNHNGNQHAIYSLTFDNATSEGLLDRSLTFPLTDKEPNTGLAPDAINLRAGKYTIYLIHRGDWTYTVGNEPKTISELNSLLHHKDYRNKFILAEIPIYIHDRDETVDFSVVHADGSVDTGNSCKLSDLLIKNTSNVNVNVTASDVSAGNIIFKVDYSGLWAVNEHTKDKCEELYGTNFGKSDNASKHKDDVCVSRKSGNESTFIKKKIGDLMYDFNDSNASNDIYHTGITYQVNLELILYNKQS